MILIFFLEVGEVEKKEVEYESVTYKKNSEETSNDKIKKKEEDELVIKYNNNRIIPERIYDDIDNKICFNLFNPQDHMSYDFIRNNWLKVYYIFNF